jgi:hypothetical protein
VKGVDRRELDKYPDVVIVSTQGKRSLASMLADGGAFATFSTCFSFFLFKKKTLTLTFRHGRRYVLGFQPFALTSELTHS